MSRLLLYWEQQHVFSRTLLCLCTYDDDTLIFDKKSLHFLPHKPSRSISSMTEYYTFVGKIYFIDAEADIYVMFICIC